jgi:hypothetical protein
MRPPRAITVVLFVLLVTACGNHNNVSIRPPDAGAPASTPSTNSNGSNVSVNVPSEGCDPNYSDCVPVASDVDCAGKGGNGPAYVQGPIRVIGKDIYGLDRDGNGIACE